MMDGEKDLRQREILALYFYKMAHGGVSPQEYMDFVTGLGFDPLVLARWSNRRLGTGPLKAKPGIVRKVEYDSAET